MRTIQCNISSIITSTLSCGEWMCQYNKYSYLFLSYHGSLARIHPLPKITILGGKVIEASPFFTFLSIELVKWIGFLLWHGWKKWSIYLLYLFCSCFRCDRFFQFHSNSVQVYVHFNNIDLWCVYIQTAQIHSPICHPFECIDWLVQVSSYYKKKQPYRKEHDRANKNRTPTFWLLHILHDLISSTYIIYYCVMIIFLSIAPRCVSGEGDFELTRRIHSA